MISAAFVARFRHFWRRPTVVPQRQPQTTRYIPSVMPVTAAAFTVQVSRPDAQMPVTVLAAQGVLDRESCTVFLAAATQLYAQGCRRLLIDLRNVTRIELAGRFALYNVARLYAGQTLLDPEAGWQVLHDATTGDSATRYRATPVLAPTALAAFLQQANLSHNLAIYSDRTSALAACPGI